MPVRRGVPVRRGRPGLVGTMARTAVVAGTALAIASFYVALWLVLGPSWTL